MMEKFFSPCFESHASNSRNHYVGWSVSLSVITMLFPYFLSQKVNYFALLLLPNNTRQFSCVSGLVLLSQCERKWPSTSRNVQAWAEMSKRGQKRSKTSENVSARASQNIKVHAETSRCEQNIKAGAKLSKPKWKHQSVSHNIIAGAKMSWR